MELSTAMTWSDKNSVGVHIICSFVRLGLRLAMLLKMSDLKDYVFAALWEFQLTDKLQSNVRTPTWNDRFINLTLVTTSILRSSPYTIKKCMLPIV